MLYHLRPVASLQLMELVRVYTGDDGQGHISRSVNGEPRTCLFIPLDDAPASDAGRAT